nr:hypothetical protein BaRGS_028475 [Batillaria attramentaria]
MTFKRNLKTHLFSQFYFFFLSFFFFFFPKPKGAKNFSKGGKDSVSRLQSQVDEVKDVMTQNIEKVMERGDRLDDLMDKTEELEASAANFQRTSRKIRKRYWWKNKKMTLILCGIAIP